MSLLTATLFLAGFVGIAHVDRVQALVIAPRISLGSSTSSLNWAGYAVVSNDGSVSAAYGSLVVPSLSCSRGTTYVALWVGIDGYNDSTVEQTGVLGECSHGAAVYSAWYEFYPASPVYCSSSKCPVKPGDHLYESVIYSASTNSFTTTLVDYGSSGSNVEWTYASPPTTVLGALRNSAEWIAERPAIANSLTTLANFGTAYYGQDYTSVEHTNYATVGGVTGAISSFNYVEITMVNYSGKILAAPSSLTSDGTSFSVAYLTSSNFHNK